MGGGGDGGERVLLAERLKAAELAVRRAQARGDGQAVAWFKAEIAKLERRAMVLLAVADPGDAPEGI